MIIERISNPRIPSQKETIIQITMSRDQFDMLYDCVILAQQEANKDSRMFLITDLIRSDFDRLQTDLKSRGE